MRWGPRWSQSEGRPLAHAVGASVVPKRRRPPRPCGGGLGGPKTKEANIKVKSHTHTMRTAKTKAEQERR